MGLARAFAQGPKPKRSLLFVWHTGEESGLWGSRYNADFPIVPIEKIVAQLNIDMIGRNRNDKPEEANTVYLVGSDRISTELHNLSEDANAKMATPMKLDYELNDPADPESIYTRSDHYSYAAKGIPIIFYTTGPPQGLPPGHRQRGEDRVPEAGAHHAARLRDGDEGREPGSRARARQQGTAHGQGSGGEDRRAALTSQTECGPTGERSGRPYRGQQGQPRPLRTSASECAPTGERKRAGLLPRERSQPRPTKNWPVQLPAAPAFSRLPVIRLPTAPARAGRELLRQG